MVPGRMAEIRDVFEEFKEYLLSLRDPNHQLLHTTRRKTFIIGFVCTFQAVIQLAEELFTLGYNYFPTFRVSQDFIETLFSKVRRMGGHNNNPTSLGFRSALRKLLTKQSITASKFANCLDCDSSTGVFSLEWSKRTTPTSTYVEAEIPNEFLAKLASLSTASNVHKDNILRYVAGYLVRKLEGKLNCHDCAQALLGNSIQSLSDHPYYSQSQSSKLLQVKDRGGLLAASDSVYHIVKRCEQIFNAYVCKSFISKYRNASKVLVALFMRSIIEDKPVVFFRHSCSVESGAPDHQSQLIRKLAESFVNIRLHHFCKLYNRTVVERGSGSDRGRLNRLIIFKHL